MKTENLILIAAFGLVAYMAYRVFKGQDVLSGPNPGVNSKGIIQNAAQPGEPGYGWTYYANGVVIGPDGSYYNNGAKVWSPA